MTLEKLKQEVLSQAERQAKAVIAEAEREEEQILGEARAKAKAIVDEKQKLGEAQARETAVELKASALLQAKRMESEAKEEVVENVLNQVRRELQEISKSKRAYEKIFETLAKQAIRALGEKEFVLKVNAKDKKLASKYGRIAGSIDTIGGVIAAKADGTIQINNTFEALLEENEEKLKQKAFEELFERHSHGKTQVHPKQVQKKKTQKKKGKK